MATTKYAPCEVCDVVKRVGELNTCEDCLGINTCYFCFEFEARGKRACVGCEVAEDIKAIRAEKTYNSLAVIAGLNQTEVASLYALAKD